MVTSIMIVGVGGQGSLLASKLLGRAAMDKGYDVKVSEVHGMSQRGGSVVTYVKFGDKVNSPIIDKGEADYIISFELLEAARYVQFLKPGGQALRLTLSTLSRSLSRPVHPRLRTLSSWVSSPSTSLRSARKSG